MIRAVLLLAFVLSLRAADDPFAEGKLEVRHTADGRQLAFFARNVSGKDIREATIAYVLRDKDGNVVESDILRCSKGPDAIVVPKDYAGGVWAMPIRDEKVVSGSFGFQEVVFTDGTRWTAPVNRK